MPTEAPRRVGSSPFPSRHREPQASPAALRSRAPGSDIARRKPASAPAGPLPRSDTGSPTRSADSGRGAPAIRPRKPHPAAPTPAGALPRSDPANPKPAATAPHSTSLAHARPGICARFLLTRHSPQIRTGRLHPSDASRIGIPEVGRVRSQLRRSHMSFTGISGVTSNIENAYDHLHSG